MKRKFDTCIYAEYFGDYGMDICNHPSKINDNYINSHDCRSCKLHTQLKGLLLPCPFCGNKKIKILQFHGSWNIICNKCGVGIKNTTIDKVIKHWNKRV